MNEALDLMRFMNNSYRETINFAILDGETWHVSKAFIEKWCVENLKGEFKVLLGNESLLKDDMAEFVIYCDLEEDRNNVLEYFVYPWIESWVDNATQTILHKEANKGIRSYDRFCY